jgi:hypothetical protein
VGKYNLKVSSLWRVLKRLGGDEEEARGVRNLDAVGIAEKRN